MRSGHCFVDDVARTLVSAASRLVSTLVHSFEVKTPGVETSLDAADTGVRATEVGW